jgi:hypothetical protein
MLTQYRPQWPALTGDANKDLKAVILALEQHFSALNEVGAIDLQQAAITASEGIQFPATQNPSTDANTLDDYEEGTCTLGFSFGGAASGVAYTQNTGTYTKIGNRVFVTGRVLFSNKGTSTGIARITGLPFTVGSTSSAYAGVAMRCENITFAGMIQGYSEINAANIVLEQIATTGAVSALTDANFANNSGVMIGIAYRI